MKKCFIILLFYILILSTINIVISNPKSTGDSVINSRNIIDNKIEKTKILQNLNENNDFFTENQGQISNDSVRYYIQGEGVWFLDEGVVFEIREETSMNSPESRVKGRELEFLLEPMARLEPLEPANYRSVLLKLSFESANQVIPKGQGLLPHKSNFFYGNDSAKWCTNIPNYQAIVYNNIYNNIDLRYYSTSKGLKYDFIVHPGGNINDIQLKYLNAQKLYIDNFGNLNIQTPLGNLVDSNLYIYQNIENNKKSVKGKFKELNSMTYGFEINDELNKDIDLIIDPLVYSTFIGGISEEFGLGIKVDSEGCAYITGWTSSLDFSTTTGVYNTEHNGELDIFVLKLNSMGSSLLYSTFIGGSNWDYGFDIAIDFKSNTYITGYTGSIDFPKIKAYDPIYNGGEDIFVLKLNPTGSSLIFSTFIGGNNLDWGESIAIDPYENVYVTGRTYSSDFPITINSFDKTFNGMLDLFVLKLNAKGSSVIYSTYVGGNNWDYGLDIIVDSNNNVIITGQTNSSNFPNTNDSYDSTYNGNFDIFVTKFNHNGSSLIFSTFIGSNNGEGADNIALDSNDNMYIAGYTESSNFPITPYAYDNTINGYYDIVIFKLDSSGSSLIYSTFIGGNHQQSPSDIGLDLNENIYVIGTTYSPDFPNTTGAFDNKFNGKCDAFVLMMNPICSSLLYSTYIGGGSYDDATGIAIDLNRNIYVTGLTMSANFPNTINAFDPTYNGDDDGFVFKLDMNLPYNFPSILDFKASRLAITRTNSIYLYSNATDIEDPEKDLTIQFEYKEPNENIWKSDFFSNLQYKDSRWETVFTPLKYAELGLYNFRVRASDKDKLFSTWFYLNYSVSVLNNIPIIEDIILSNNRVLSGDKTTIWINGSDVEEPEKNLTVELEYIDNNGLSWDTTNLGSPKYHNERWEYIFNIPLNSPFGYYDFRARFNDSDGNYSKWLYLNDSLLVYNKQPTVLDIKLSNGTVYRTNSVFLYVNGTDYETPENILKLFTQYKQNNEDKWTVLNGNFSNLNHCWECEFKPSINSVLGVYNFRIKFENNESFTSNWSYLNDSLEVLNNPPKIFESFDNIKIGFEPRFINLSKFGSDIENAEEYLTWSIDQSSVDNTLFSVSVVDISNNILNLIPQKSASGIDDITLILKDKDGDKDIKTNITFYIGETINRYYNANISVIPNPVGIKEGQSQNVTLIITNIGYLSDNYTIFFDSETFIINDIQLERNFISINSGEKKSVNVTINVPNELKIDTYKIKFKIESDFSINDTILTINVKEKDFGYRKEEYNYMVFIIILILMIIVILIHMFIIKRRKKQNGDLLSSKNITIKPSTQPSISITQNRTPKPPIPSDVTKPLAPIVTQQPKTVVMSRHAQLGKPSITAPTPLTGNFPQFVQQPKLPPAQSQETKIKKDEI